jgi:hypothetical protein
MAYSNYHLTAPIMTIMTWRVGNFFWVWNLITVLNADYCESMTFDIFLPF